MYRSTQIFDLEKKKLFKTCIWKKLNLKTDVTTFIYLKQIECATSGLSCKWLFVIYAQVQVCNITITY